MAEPTLHTFATPGHVSLRVDVPAGKITVETWSEPHVEVEVLPARRDDRSEQAAAATSVTVTERGNGHEVQVRAPKRGGKLGIVLGRGAELAVSIRCPEGADLHHSSESADLECPGRLGAVSVRTASGNVSLNDTGSLSSSTASGDLSAGAVAGALTAKSASGDVDVGSVGETTSVNTVSGDVRLGDTAGAASVQTVAGDIALERAGGGVRAGSVSGDVEVAFAPGLALRVDAQSVSGTMRSELDIQDAPSGEATEETLELRVRTVSGDVRLTRAAAPVG